MQIRVHLNLSHMLIIMIPDTKLTPYNKIKFNLDVFDVLSPGEKKRAELQEAADQVGDSIHHLVDAVRTNTL